jgi:hypothetical protein
MVKRNHTPALCSKSPDIMANPMPPDGRFICVDYTPMDFSPTTRIAFIEAPDSMSIELVHRKSQVVVGQELG